MDMIDKLEKELSSLSHYDILNLLATQEAQNVRINDVSQIALILCYTWYNKKCENCPVKWDNSDHRDDLDKQMGGSCQAELWRWIKLKTLNKINKEGTT